MPNALQMQSYWVGRMGPHRDGMEPAPLGNYLTHLSSSITLACFFTKKGLSTWVVSSLNVSVAGFMVK